MDWGCQSTVSSMYTLTEGRQCVCMAIHGWTRDVRVTVSFKDTLAGGVGSAIVGWTRDVRVTVSSMDTPTGDRQCVYGLYGYSDRG